MGEDGVIFTTQQVDQKQTRVTWGMEGESKYPMNLMTALIKGALEKDLEVSLLNLKNVLERSSELNATA